MFCCTFCENAYSLESSLKRHQLQKHPETIVSVKKKFKCPQCDKSYNSRSGLRNHEENIHKKCFEKSNDQQVKCSECSYKCSKMEDLCQHVGNAHNVEIKKESLDFDSMEKFVAWKKKIELDTKSAFVKHAGDNQYSTGKVSHFYCNRSGYYKNESNNKRHLKMQGSSKMNAFCCAHIKLKMPNDGKLSAEFVLTHTGHDLELGHLRLSQSEKDMLAGKIARKIPFKEIVKEIRQTPASSTSRVHVVTFKDLYNIRSSYGLDTDILKHKDDETSIKGRINLTRQCPNSAIKTNFCKPTHSVCRNMNLNHKGQFTQVPQPPEDKVPKLLKDFSTSACDKTSKFYASREKFKKEFDSILHSVTNEAELKVALRIMKSIKPILKAMKDTTSSTNLKIKSNFKEGKIINQRLYSTKRRECSKSSLQKLTCSEIGKIYMNL